MYIRCSDIRLIVSLIVILIVFVVTLTITMKCYLATAQAGGGAPSWSKFFLEVGWVLTRSLP